MLETLLVVVEHRGVIFPQLERPQQQFGKVDNAKAIADIFILAVDTQHGQQVGIAGLLDMGGPEPLVFLCIDPPLGLLWRPALFIQIHTAHDSFNQSKLIVRIKYLEILRQFGIAPVGLEQTMGDAVEGAHPHPAQGHTQQLVDALAHLPGSLIGKGDGENAVGGDILNLDLPGDTVDQNPGLTAACTRQHQEVLLVAGHRFFLGRV